MERKRVETDFFFLGGEMSLLPTISELGEQGPGRVSFINYLEKLRFGTSVYRRNVSKIRFMASFYLNSETFKIENRLFFKKKRSLEKLKEGSWNLGLKYKKGLIQIHKNEDILTPFLLE